MQMYKILAAAITGEEAGAELKSISTSLLFLIRK